MKVLVLGANGMLGSALVKVLNKSHNLIVYGTVRNESAINFFNESIGKNIISDIRVENKNSLEKAFSIVQPDVVINCIGIIKQLDDSIDPLQIIQINALLPHCLAKMCELSSARLIHISTDCIFDGAKGSYKESDSFDAKEQKCTDLGTC